jgi:hypothetical protein
MITVSQLKATTEDNKSGFKCQKENVVALFPAIATHKATLKNKS